MDMVTNVSAYISCIEMDKFEPMENEVRSVHTPVIAAHPGVVSEEVAGTADNQSAVGRPGENPIDNRQGGI